VQIGIVTDVSEYLVACTFRIVLECSEVADGKLFRNVDKRVPVYMASHPGRLKPSTSPQWDLQISHFISVVIIRRLHMQQASVVCELRPIICAYH